MDRLLPRKWGVSTRRVPALAPELNTKNRPTIQLKLVSPVRDKLTRGRGSVIALRLPVAPLLDRPLLDVEGLGLAPFGLAVLRLEFFGLATLGLVILRLAPFPIALPLPPPLLGDPPLVLLVLPPRTLPPPRSLLPPRRVLPPLILLVLVTSSALRLPWPLVLILLFRRLVPPPRKSTLALWLSLPLPRRVPPLRK